MPRCFTCAQNVAIRARNQANGPLRTWPSYANLGEFAEAGCDVCALIRQHLTTRLSEDLLLANDGEVRLNDSWGLTVKCGASDDAFDIGFHETIENSRTASPYDASKMMTHAAKWLKTCIERHTSCTDLLANRTHTTSMLPRRLLDLSHGPNIVIADVYEWVALGLSSLAELSEYCTLSYQWGNAPHSCVLSHSFDTLFEVALGSMPQTFKDAITIARALGVRFMWIDALCIVQPAASGDDTDWRIEGPRMGVIYENSMFTIAATCARSADDGILSRVGNSVYGARPCRVLDLRKKNSTTNATSVPSTGGDDSSQQFVLLAICEPSFFRSVSSSSLNSRGWVMQERALSRRLIHFTEYGMFWECCEAKLHELFGDVDPRNQSAPCSNKETLLSVARARSSSYLCPVEWFHFIEQYSACGFTNAQDRLIALSSVAQAAQPMLGGHDYYAGLWSHELVRGLMWHCSSPSTNLRLHTNSLAPTWSWASVEGKIEFVALGMETFSEELVEVVNVETACIDAENPFGNLASGRLMLRGRPLKVCLPTVNSWYRDMQNRLLVFWDEPQDTSQRYREYVVLPIGACKGTGMSAEGVVFGALILALATEARCYSVYLNADCDFRRVGWVEYVYREGQVERSRSAYGWLRNGKQNWWEEYATIMTVV
ncbi:heterokaryon incompatibility protein-domain-containing protein [Phaeosphaeria sp. MPI-PUGE-AT-0046c]|nr:heterokaryon incompatibility protein-domain-containing protein [Phaeosphaeria sp. MPI-PUGE-AT-0046c]